MKKAILIAAVIVFATLLSAQSITVTSPNGNEGWVKGSTHDITWTTSGINSGTFRITLWQGGTNLGIVAQDIDYTVLSFRWTVGHLINAADPSPGEGFLIKVRQQSLAPMDFSDGPFTITDESSSGLRPAGEIHTFPPRPPFTKANQPPLEFHGIPNLQVSELFYDYRNKRCEARVKNIGSTSFNGRFRWEWYTDCGSRAAYKDIPSSQAAQLNSERGMPFTFDCSPPLHECGIHAIFSIEPITDQGTRLNQSQMEKDLPRYEHTQFLMSERHVMLRFLNGSVHLNANQGHTITRDNAYDSNDDFTTATFRVVVGIRNCGGEAGRFDQWPALGLYWSVHHWPSNTYTLQPNRFVTANHIQSPLAPGQGISITRVLTLPIRSGRYELRFHMGSNHQEHPVSSFYIRFADELTH